MCEWTGRCKWNAKKKKKDLKPKLGQESSQIREGKGCWSLLIPQVIKKQRHVKDTTDDVGQTVSPVERQGYSKQVRSKVNAQDNWHSTLGLKLINAWWLSATILMCMFTFFLSLLKREEDFAQTKEATHWRLHSCGASVHREANLVLFCSLHCFLSWISTIKDSVNSQLENDQRVAAFIVPIVHGNYIFMYRK